MVPHRLVSNELDSKVLKSERYVLVGSSGWKKRSTLEIIKNERIVDFDPSDQMSFNYLKQFKLLEHAKSERHFLNNNESLVEFIAAGLGYGVLTLEFAEKFLKKNNITLLNDGRVYENSMALTWYPRPCSRPYWNALIDAFH